MSEIQIIIDKTFFLILALNFNQHQLNHGTRKRNKNSYTRKIKLQPSGYISSERFIDKSGTKD